MLVVALGLLANSPRGYGCGAWCGGYGNYSTEFSVTANAGYALDVTGFSFDEWNSSAFGPHASTCSPAPMASRRPS